MLKIADEQTERLVHLVNNVLDLQRIQSGKITMNKQACQASELMLEAVQTMKTLAQEQDIQLSVRPSNLYRVGRPRLYSANPNQSSEQRD